MTVHYEADPAVIRSKTIAAIGSSATAAPA